MKREHAEKLTPGTYIVVSLQRFGETATLLLGEVVKQRRSGVQIKVEGIVHWQNIEGLMRAPSDLVPKSRIRDSRIKKTPKK